MAKLIRLGNDITVTWTITRLGLPEDFTNKDVTVKLLDKQNNQCTFNYTITGNKITGTFYGKDQSLNGTYRLELIENDGKTDMVTLDFIDCFILSYKLKNTTSQGSDPSTITTETVNLTSNISTIGDNIDFNNYYTKDEVDDLIPDTSDFVSSDDVYTKTEIDNKDAAILDNAVKKMFEQENYENSDFCAIYRMKIRKGFNINSRPIVLSPIYVGGGPVNNCTVGDAEFKYSEFVDNKCYKEWYFSGVPFKWYAYAEVTETNREDHMCLLTIYIKFVQYRDFNVNYNFLKDNVFDVDTVGWQENNTIFYASFDDDNRIDTGYKLYKLQSQINNTDTNLIWEGTQDEYDALDDTTAYQIYLIK